MMISKVDSAFNCFNFPKTTNNSDSSLRRARVKRRGAGILSIALLAAALHASPAYAAENDAVSVWNERAAVTLVNGNTAATPGLMFPPPVAFIHLAIVQAAVYDAVNAIKGGHYPYLEGLKAATSASQDAAASTAAHHVLIGLITQAPLTTTLTSQVKADIKARLDTQYAASLAEIPAGQAKVKGIEVGAAAASAMLANRLNDGRFGAAGFPVGSAPGEWRPISAAPAANDPNGWVRNVRPFALPSSHYFHTSGPPLPLSGAQYATEFNEVKSLGRATGSTRTAAQTELANFTGAHPVPMLYAAMRQVATSKGLTISEQARFHAMTSMSAADSLINCWAEKAHWGFWRPTTAIQLAADDGNDATAADPDWTSLLALPPYPDEPSGANCVFSGFMHAAKAFFGSDTAEFDIVSTGPAGTVGLGSTRHYSRFTDVIPDIIEARIYGGLHFRTADVNGADLGRRVAAYVDANVFNCGPPGQCKQERRK
ncbi:vanadium-dependent haloperoxidase [Sphingomonas sp. NSE70-1]|uniref:Vanadium-dependent haloperoxidase n=1 Tax=Sphingomonas caseinilyticus TaxID=2908205 RepID=A0ABT0RX80_9SPHN|nr:vanadium-dependent haloperoxidase [Sphingomonas caseinilyticus]MCL6699613.1 vanadium-dependent haloperoxidase [Sphingomonas caseinilyticus]